MLELVTLRKVYSGIPVVEEVSFTARAGEITGYLGANGSGKSTTMKMVTGLIEPSGGVVLFDGKPILDDLMTFRQRVGYVPRALKGRTDSVSEK
jgi:ABC-2 type transport system ATP-binding protein